MPKRNVAEENKRRIAAKALIQLPEDSVPTKSEIRELQRLRYLQVHTDGKKQPIPVLQAVRTADGQVILPRLDGFGNRSLVQETTWRVVQYGDAQRPVQEKGIAKKLQGEMEYLNSYWGWRGPIGPEYNLLEPYVLLDTESYFKQALKRKHSLMFRNGVRFVGDSVNFVNYAERRASQIGYVSGQTFTNLLKDILWNLLICSNCVVIKVRDQDASGGVSNEKNDNRLPVAGYVIVPPHTIYPCLDGKGRIEKWRRYFKNGQPYRDYPVEDIIHFFWDRKPGHLFGTPRTVAVTDDIYALRRLEENTELLIIHHLFPVTQVKVGTEKAPCEYYPNGTSEVDYIRSLIMNMPKEGVLVTDERVEVETKGAGGQGVDPKPLIEHYKQRIFTGLGVSPIDMGEGNTSNRATADNVSQNLKDQIKSDLDWFADQVQMGMLKDWYQESSSNLSVQNAVRDVSLEFHEIDTDNLIKEETHALNKYNNNAITHAELRKKLKAKPLSAAEEGDTQFSRQVVSMAKLQQQHAVELQAQAAKHQAAAGAGPKKKTTVRKSKSRSASGGTTTSTTTTTEGPAKTPAAKKTATQVQPENQHGKNLDPHKAKSARLIRGLYDELCLALLDLSRADELNRDGWSEAVRDIVGIFFPGEENQDRRGVLERLLPPATDLDLTYSLLQSII